MKKYELLKIEMPEVDNWGIIQIKPFKNTFFRFEIIDGKPVLDTSLFANQVEDPSKKHRFLSKDNDIYKGVQILLNEIIIDGKLINSVYPEQEEKIIIPESEREEKYK